MFADAPEKCVKLKTAPVVPIVSPEFNAQLIPMMSEDMLKRAQHLRVCSVAQSLLVLVKIAGIREVGFKNISSVLSFRDDQSAKFREGLYAAVPRRALRCSSTKGFTLQFREGLYAAVPRRALRCLDHAVNQAGHQVAVYT